jgi:hypothetical protein
MRRITSDMPTVQVPITIPGVQEVGSLQRAGLVQRIGKGIKGNPYLTSRVTNKLREPQVIRKTSEIRIVLSRERC